MESVLYYHRPMLEDGEIEYEFYYREGQYHTHPTLDRLTFMLDPKGIRVHWTTDGPYDRTGLDPANTSDEPKNRRGPRQLPLRPNTWNRVRLSLKGDTVYLSLNDQLVYERQLEITNQRTFGLFHYAGRTESRVRNVVWRGDWPRELPPIEKQELAGKGKEFLDDMLPQLTNVFEHDFASDGLPSSRFTVLEPGWQDFVLEKPDGVHVSRPGGGHYLSYSIAPRCTVKGDFDAVLKFKQFKPDVPRDSKETKCSLILSAYLDDDAATESYVYRRFHRMAEQEDAQLVIGQFTRMQDGEKQRSYFGGFTSEAKAGRLRLARRGDKMFFLFAEEDSTNYRLVGERNLSGADLKPNGIRIHTQTFGQGSLSTVLEKITIRAKSIDHLRSDEPQKVIALNAQRDKLPQHFVHDFSKDATNETLFGAWALPASLERTASGLPMVAPGTDNWTSVGLATQFGLTGDFDVAIELGNIEFGHPKEGKNSSFYLQIEFPDKQKTQANMIYIQYPNGNKQAYAQNRTVNEKGKSTYRRLRVVPVKSVKRMRLTRQGRKVSHLFQRNGSDDYEILAQSDIGDQPISKASIRLMLHTGGAGVESVAVLKQFSVHAEKIDSLPPEVIQIEGRNE